MGTKIDMTPVANAIEASNRAAIESQKLFREQMNKSDEEHKKTMEMLYRTIENSKNESMKIMDNIRKEQKEKIEKYEKEEKEKKLRKEQKKIEANKQLINETNFSKESILSELEQEFDENKDAYCLKEINEMKITDEIDDLFYKLFETEKLKDIFLQEIFAKIKEFKFTKEINSYNIQIIGNTGVGKSTLINALLRSEKAATSTGSVCTLETKEYTSEKFPFIKFIDTRGTELDPKNNINKIKENTLNYIDEKLSKGEPNETIHCLLYCLTGIRFQDIEKHVLLELRKKYQNGNLPIIIVYTKCIDKDEFNEMKAFINQELKSNSFTEMGDDIKDINIVPVLAMKKKLNGNHILPPEGLDILMTFLKKKAAYAFDVATINMIKNNCSKFSIALFEQECTKILKDLEIFMSTEKNKNTILYDTIKYLFLRYIPTKNYQLSKESKENIKKTVQILTEKLNEIQNKKLSEFSSESSEKIGAQVQKTQYNVICQNSGVELNGLKEYTQYKKEGQKDLSKKLKEKSEYYAILNLRRNLYYRLASKFKVLFKEKIEEIINNEQSIVDLINSLKGNISENITHKIDGLIDVLKEYQSGVID